METLLALHIPSHSSGEIFMYVSTIFTILSMVLCFSILENPVFMNSYCCFKRKITYTINEETTVD